MKKESFLPVAVWAIQAYSGAPPQLEFVINQMDRRGDKTY